MQLLRDVEEGLVGIEDVPTRLKAQVSHHGNQRLQDLGDAPAEGGGVYVDDT